MTNLVEMIRFGVFLFAIILCIACKEAKVDYSPPCPECSANKSNGILKYDFIADSVYLSPLDTARVLPTLYFTHLPFLEKVAKGDTIKSIFYLSEGRPTVVFSFNCTGTLFIKYDSLGFANATGVLGPGYKHVWWMQTVIDSALRQGSTNYGMPNEMVNFDLPVYYSKTWRMDSADIINYMVANPIFKYKEKFTYDQGKLIKRIVVMELKDRKDTSHTQNPNSMTASAEFVKMRDSTKYSYSSYALKMVDNTTTYAVGDIIRSVSWYDKEEVCRGNILVFNNRSFIRCHVVSEGTDKKGYDRTRFWLNLTQYGIYLILSLTSVLYWFKAIKKSILWLGSKVFRRSN
jgi:hypothetical protein